MTRVGPDRLRVLVTADAVGGVWSYALDLAAGLQAQGFDILVAVLGPAPSIAHRGEAAARDVELVTLPHEPEWLADDAAALARAGAALADLARRWGADLVHLNSPALAGEASFSCPVVAVHHSCVATWWAAVRGGALPPDLAWRAASTRRGLMRADVLVAPTRAFAAATASVYGLPRTPLVVHNGRAPAGTGTSFPAAAPVFTAGRLWDQGKNIAALDRVAGDLAEPVLAAGPIVGPQGDRQTFRHLQLAGPLDPASVRRHLRGRPIYVAPALFEPFGLAVLEAGQAGCPLVLNDLPTFRELWDGAAVFVEARDTAALRCALRCILDDPQQHARLGRAAQVRAGRYTCESMVEATMTIYAGACARPASRAIA